MSSDAALRLALRLVPLLAPLRTALPASLHGAAGCAGMRR